MCKFVTHLQLRHLPGQFQDEFRASGVEQNGFSQRLVETDCRGRVVNHLHGVGQQTAVRLADGQVRFAHVPGDRQDFVHHFRAVHFLQQVEQLKRTVPR